VDESEKATEITEKESIKTEVKEEEIVEQIKFSK
jgi:hypothetical protein